MVHPYQSWSILSNHGLSRSILVYPKQSRFIPNNPGLSWAILVYSKRYIISLLLMTDTVKTTQASYKCPIKGCEYETGMVEAIVAAPLLSLHANSHAPAHVSSSSSRPPPVDRPKINSNCEKADWLIFKAKWKSFKHFWWKESASVNWLPWPWLSYFTL